MATVTQVGERQQEHMVRRDPAPHVQDIFQQLHSSEASFLFHVTMFMEGSVLL